LAGLIEHALEQSVTDELWNEAVAVADQLNG
jgi:hypothetical protein